MNDEELKALMLATRTEGYPEDLRPLVEAVQALEREACAKVCETHTVDDVLVGVGIAQSCAAAIRARSKE